jgi:hypothetical protein
MSKKKKGPKKGSDDEEEDPTKHLNDQGFDKTKKSEKKARC